MVVSVSVALFIVFMRVARARGFFDLVPRAARNFWLEQFGRAEAQIDEEREEE